MPEEQPSLLHGSEISLLNAIEQVQCTCLTTCNMLGELPCDLPVLHMQVGAWILWSTYQLFDCYRKNLLAQHPMFAFTAQQNSAAAGQQGGLPNPFAQQVPPGTYQPPAATVVQGYPVQTYPPGYPPARV